MNIKKIIKKIDENVGIYQLYFSNSEIQIENEEYKRIFFFLVPSYGNLGDEAIVEATIAFFKEKFNDYKIIEIDFDESISTIKSVKKIINRNDIIVLQGGGNFGTLYYNIEVARRLIIKSFKNNLIISMPQSFYYDNTLKGKERQRKSLSIYNGSNNILIFARDKNSYAKMSAIYSNVFLMPDIVFYLTKKMHIEKKERINILTCLRTDSESIFSEHSELLNMLYNEFYNIVVSDTYVPRRVYKSTREIEIRSLIIQYSEAKCVITDRLHGMIFAVLTNTPCVVLPSLDNKIEGTYDWINSDPNIIFCRDGLVDTIKESINKLLSKSISEYDCDQLHNEYFNQLTYIIRKKMKEL